MDKESIFQKISPQAPLPPVRFTEQHKGVVRGTFRDEWQTLTILRDLFFGIPLTEFEKEVVKGFSKEVKDILRMMMYSKIEKTTPIGDSKDAWSQIELRGLPTDKQIQEIQTRELLNTMLVKACNLLDDPNGEKPFTNDIHIEDSTPTTAGAYINFLMARADFINITENKLRLLHALAYSTEETQEETKKRIKQDSSR